MGGGGGGGGGLNCEAKVQALVVMPLPLFFLEVGCKKGGRNSRAVRYMYSVYVTMSEKREHSAKSV